MSAAYQFASICCYGHSNLVILNRISSKNFIYGLLSLNPGSGLNMSFVGQTITKMADKMVATYQFVSLCCCGHSNLVTFIKFLPIFIYGLLPSSLNMSFVRPTIAKMANNWPPPTSTPYLSHLFPDCFQTSYMDYFYQTLTKVWIWALSANPRWPPKWLQPIGLHLWAL